MDAHHLIEHVCEKKLKKLFVFFKYWFQIKGSSSVIRDHINQSGHAASVNDFSILDRANNDFDVLIHESLLILRDQPELNSQQSSILLVLF